MNSLAGQVLKTLLHIDIMSSDDCGTVPVIQACRGDGFFEDRHKCFDQLGKEYKFILAIENSDCTDYITEKVWFNAFKHNMVPLVRLALVLSCR